ncbi:MAG TPA: PAS domain S-box protein, partial [Chryseosolibacter sp.]|nr:PAS domain S-box protein [Chryseosolibacter sp.]
VIGRLLHDTIVPGEYRHQHQLGVRRFLQTGESTVMNRTIEVPALRRDGTMISIELTISSVKVGPDYIFISFLRDITDRKRADEQLSRLNETLEQRVAERTAAVHESESKYRQLFERNPIPLMIFELEGFRFIDVNEAAVIHYGYSREEFLRMTAVDIRPAEEKERFINLDRNTGSGMRRTGVWKHIKKDGSVIYSEVTAYNVVCEGKPARLSLAVDVTEKIKVEQALRSSEAKFRKIFNSRLIGFVFWDAEGRITEANDFFLEQVGYTRSELEEGRVRWTELTPPEYLQRDYAAIEQIAQKGYCDPFEKEYIRKDGTRFPVLVGGTSLEGVANAGVAYMMDMSERKKMQQEIVEFNKELEQRVAERTEELQQANQELESFSYSVSHDLRAPLRAIDGYAQMFLEDYSDKVDHEGFRVLGLIRHYAKKMGQLVDDLLEFSRIGKRELNRVASDMTAIARDVLWEFNFGSQTRYRVNVNPLGEATVDPSFVKLVFRNLISNAIKYSAKTEAPLIEIGANFQDGATVYYVKDNGAGFDMTFYHKLFGVFQRLHGEDEFEGTGIGLAISERVVKKHGGRIWAHGQPGNGATFYFTLSQDRTTNKQRSGE